MTRKRSVPSFAPASSALLLASAGIVLAFAGIVLAYAGIVLACSWIDEDELRYSFFAPETSPSPEYTPFYRSFHALYEEYLKEDNIRDFRAVNIAEWKAFLPAAVSDSDIAAFLYDTDTPQLELLGGGPPGGGRDGLRDGLRNDRSAAARVLRSVQDDALRRDIAAYLHFAKRCEPFSTYVQPWPWLRDSTQADPRHDTDALAALATEGSAEARQCRHAFLRERYLFQTVRVLFQARRSEDCARFFAAHETAFGPNGSMHYRAMGYAAGALYRIRRYAEANRLYAVIYDACPPMKRTACLSFHPQEEGDWRQALALAADTREECVLWHLAGIYADPLRAMREIARRDASSDLLDLLLVRAVNIAEEAFLPERWSYEGAVAEHALRAESVDAELVAFVAGMTARDSTHAPQLWNLAAAYLHTARGAHAEALPCLERARSLAPRDTLVQEQARVIDILRTVEQSAAPSPEREEELRGDLVWLQAAERHPRLRRNAVFAWARRRLSTFYAQRGDMAKAVCLYPPVAPGLHRDSALQAAMLAFMDKPAHTPYERLLLSLYPHDRSDMVELQALGLLYKDRLQEALARFESDAGAGARILAGDPFSARTVDCHDCDHAAPAAVQYTKERFTRRMLELRRLAASGGRDAARHWFALGNGYYNMTYFGNARLLYETDVHSYGWMDVGHPEPGWARDPLFDCSRAAACYRRAMEASREKELRARCCFMLAKCEQNAFYLTRPDGYAGDFRSGTYFRAFGRSFAGTQYYREVIRDCGYFRTWLAKR